MSIYRSIYHGVYGADGSIYGDDFVGGISWDEGTDVYTRLGALAGYPLSASPGGAVLPIHAQMARCIVNDLGTIQYMLDAVDSTKKADGTAAVLDGTAGQVMVRVPKFWWKYSYAAPIHSWLISDRPRAGYTVHPAFIKAGFEVDYRYIGAYEACLDGTKLCSVSGQLPQTAKTRANFRGYAAARGTGWHQQDLYLYSAIQLLYLIEYADFNTQSMIGAGLTDWASATWDTYNSYYPINATGLSNGLGNGSGSVSNGDGVVGSYMSYRGVENWYGHIWKFVDGLNVHNSTADRSRAFACGDHTAFADDTDTGYTLIGLLPEADGYVKTILYGGLFLPQTTGGSSATYLCDNYYTYFDSDQASGWRVVYWGGTANAGALAGAFFVSSNSGSSNASATLGGRLCF